MNFNNLQDLFQFFVNEYISPGNKVLILNYYDENLKKMISFIDSDSFFVCDQQSKDHFDLVSDYFDLPFEEKSFDIIINFTDNFNLLKFLKQDGKILTHDEILNGLFYYYIGKKIYTIL